MSGGYSGMERRQSTCPHGASCQEPEIAAERAVQKFLFQLGFDITNAADMAKFRAGIQFGEASQKVAKNSAITILTVLISLSVTYIFWRLTGFGGKG